MIIAMWSGPRNLSTAMMYAFAARGDCAVVDEPFYAAYLAATGIDHPMRDAVLASQDTDPDKVVSACRTPDPALPLTYQKHMAQHMLPGIRRDWLRDVRNVFLIRHPARVVASYAAKRENPTLDDLGFRQQADLFDDCAARGLHPLVIEFDRHPARSGGPAEAAVRGAGHRLDRGDAALAGGRASRRWRLGGALVRGGASLDRVRQRRRAAAATGRRRGGAGGSGAAGLRPACGAGHRRGRLTAPRGAAFLQQFQGIVSWRDCRWPLRPALFPASRHRAVYQSGRADHPDTTKSRSGCPGDGRGTDYGLQHQRRQRQRRRDQPQTGWTTGYITADLARTRR